MFFVMKLFFRRLLRTLPFFCSQRFARVRKFDTIDEYSNYADFHIDIEMM